jgi:transcriptional regulator of acetoin/glycerol metabolism
VQNPVTVALKARAKVIGCFLDRAVSAAARMLGIQRTTLIEKMRKFSIGRSE